MKRLQTRQGEHFHSEEVRSHHHCHVRPDEVSPAGVPFPLLGWRNIMPIENVPDRLVRDPIAQISHRSDDPIIAPARVLFGDLYD